MVETCCVKHEIRFVNLDLDPIVVIKELLHLVIIQMIFH